MRVATYKNGDFLGYLEYDKYKVPNKCDKVEVDGNEYTVLAKFPRTDVNNKVVYFKIDVE